MSRPLPFLLVIATICLYFATAIRGLGIPAGVAKNASQFSIRAKEFDEFQISQCLRSCGIMRGISEDLFHTFELMAQYAAAAYCTGNNNSSGTLVTCPAKTCPLVEEARARTVSEFENMKGADDTGFVAVDDAARLIVLSFRGSRSAANLYADMRMDLSDTDLCRACKVHKGFWNAWVGIRDDITALALRMTENYPDFRFAITGHSLGGALATLAAGALRDVNDDLRERIELYSFGSPRVGDMATVHYLTTQSSRSYRVTNRLDVIPRLPPFLFGYFNTAPEYFITHHSRNPKPDDFEVIESYRHGGNSDTGDFFRGWKKHHAYFMKDIAKCSNKEKDPS